MNKLRLKEIKLLVKDHILNDRNEVSKVPNLILTLFLLYKETALSETLGLEQWIQTIWQGWP